VRPKLVILKVITNPPGIHAALTVNGNIVDNKVSGLLPPIGDRYFSDNESCYILPFESDEDALAFKLRNTGMIFI